MTNKKLSQTRITLKAIIGITYVFCIAFSYYMLSAPVYYSPLPYNLLIVLPSVILLFLCFTSSWILIRGIRGTARTDAFRYVLLVISAVTVCLYPLVVSLIFTAYVISLL